MLEILELVLILISLLVFLLWISEKTSLPTPFVLVPAGIAISFVTSFPTIDFNPELALFVFLPPLVYSGGFVSSWAEFRKNLRPILLLSVGLVFFTTLGVAWIAYYFIPGLSWPEALVLGAIVSPPDVVAIVAIAKKLGLPRRIVTILEGEGLFNDATALTLFRLALTFVAAGGSHFSFGDLTLRFLVTVFGELAYGLSLAWLVGRLGTFLKNPHLELVVSFIVPFLAYLPPEQLGGSGVLATVVAGIYAGQKNEESLSYQTRLKTWPVWDFLVNLLHDVLFLLTGLQFRSVVARLGFISPWELFKRACLISLTVIVIRIIWIFPITYIPRLVSPRLRKSDPIPPWSWVFVLSWAGMRGAVSLAAALAIPELIGEKTPFLGRDLIIFLTFSVILSTLLFQGLSLIPLIRTLGLQKVHKEESQKGRSAKLRARKLVIKAVLGKIRKWRQSSKYPDTHLGEAEDRYLGLLKNLDETSSSWKDDSSESRFNIITRSELNAELISFKRRILRELRKDGIISDQQLRDIQWDLDLQELQLDQLGIG